MSRRTKIIFGIILAVLLVAIFWFIYEKNQQSQNVRGQNGNVSSLFPFTGTNATDYQQEPNSGLPTKTSSGTGNGSGNGSGGNGGNGNGLGNGSGNNNGLGLYSGNGIGNGFGDVLNLNDLTVGDGTNGSYNYPTLGLQGVGLDNGGSGDSNCPGCNPGLDPYAGEISLTANGSAYYANVSSDGGNVELAWVLGNGAPIDTTGISCMASSSRGDWTGGKDPNGGPDTVTIPANTTQNVLSRTYTLNCTGIGGTTVTVNIAGVNADGSTGIIGGALNFTVDNSVIALVNSDGGSVDLAWNIQYPPSVTSTACTGSSSAGDWTGSKAVPTGTDTVSVPSNTGTSTLSRTYTLSCTSLGAETVTVNTNISDDAFADRTPEFMFTANGAKTLTVTSGTPVDLNWQVRNLNASSCIGTSDGSYAGWGTNYTYSADTISSVDSANLASYTSQLIDKQAQLTALTSLTASSGTSTVTTTDIQNQITTVQNNLNTTTANITSKSNDIAQTKVNLQGAVTNVTNLTSQLNTKQAEYTQLQSHQASLLGGLTLDAIDAMSPSDTAAAIDDASSTILNIQNTLLPAANAQKATYTAQLSTQNSDLANLNASSTAYKSQLKTLTKVLSATQTTAQVTQDNAVAAQIASLQYDASTLQTKIDAINNKYSTFHLHKLSTGKTIEQPSVDVGPTATSFTEIAGLENVVAYGFVNGTSGATYTGSDGSGGSIVGDVPITTKRMYTLTCTDATGKVLPPQTVVINIDDSGNNNNGGNGTDTDPSFTFLANGSVSPNISEGDSVKLTWQVANLPANSCRGSSTSGLYEGWGASFQRVEHVRSSNGNIVAVGIYKPKPADFIFYTNDLVADPGGTLKAPSAAVGTNPQTYTEVVGADNSITTTRTYTLTCTDATGTALPPQTVTINVSNTPQLTFLIDGVTHESVATGTTATLSWDVQNIKGGTCKATSSGNVEDLATSNGNFLGWGADLEAPRASYAGEDPLTEKRKLITAVLGGTTKDPSTDVSSISKNFTEIIGQDGSIDSSERSYTLTCTGLDGTTIVTQTVVLNGPDDGGGGDNNHNPSNDPCADDMDISMALTNLQSYINTYKSITGNSITNTGDEDFNNNGDPLIITHEGDNPFAHDGDAQDSLDSCMTDTYRTVSAADHDQIVDAAGNDDPTKYNYDGPLTRTVYDPNVYDSTQPLDPSHPLNSTSPSGYPTSPSFLPHWVWVDDDMIRNPGHTPAPFSVTSWTVDYKTYIATGTLSTGGTMNGIYVGDLMNIANISYAGDGGSVCPSSRPCLYQNNPGNPNKGDAWSLGIPPDVTKGDMYGEPYVDANGNNQTLGAKWWPYIDTSATIGNGGYPLVDATGAAAMTEGNHFGDDTVTYRDNYFFPAGAPIVGTPVWGIGDKIEKAAGFY